MIVKGIRLIAGTPEVINASGKQYTSHCMLAFTGFTSNLKGWVQEMKDAGYNNIWAYSDYFDYAYQLRCLELMDACHEVGGITVTVGAHGANAGYNDINMMLVTKDHPAMYRINGKPVYTYYGWNYYNYNNTLNLLAANGLQRSDYILLVNGLYAYQIEWGITNPDNGHNLLQDFRDGVVTDNPHIIVYGEPGAQYSQPYYYYDDGLVILNYTGSPHKNDKGVPFMLDEMGIDGLVNFAVDKSTTNIINENNWVNTKVNAREGKYYMAGVNAFYASVSFQDRGFDGAASVWQNILMMPAADRPLLLNDTTTNDFVELSYQSPMPTPVVNGLSYLPELSRGFTVGDNTRFVLTDHTGVQKFLRPYVNAYLSDADAITITQDKIFAWYWLHPVDAPVIPTIPPEVVALGNQFTQAYWASTVYGTVNRHNVYGIKSFLFGGINKIRMAAHLTSPAYLKIGINGQVYTSPLREVGLAYWEIPQELGTPSFSIVSDDGSTVRKSGVGPQPITNSCYPGGWNPLIVEI
jgi:hypothetical protein